MVHLSQTDTAAPGGKAPRGRMRELVAVLVGLGLAAVLGIAVWLLVRGDSESDAVATATPFGPAIVDETTLRAETARVGHTVYWMPPKGQAIELTIVQDGTVHVRYLPAGSTTPDPQNSHTTVSSWPMADPLARAQQSAASEAAMSEDAEGGGLYVASSESPYNAYIAAPNTSALGEVYNPKAGQAWRDVTNGKVTPLQP